MIEKLYNILSIYIGGSIFFTFGICFLFLTVAKSQSLRNYLKARRIIACAYLFLALGNVVEYFSRSPDDNIQLTQMITLVVGCSQSFLFTYVFITLINPRFLSGKKTIKPISLFLLFVATLFAVYFLCPAAQFNYLFIFYILIYAFLLLRLTRMFLTNYRRYTFQMDNFYSGEEARHLNWVHVSFFAALAIGVLALLNALFMSAGSALLFSVVILVFYTTFALCFLNYPFVFHYIETAITPGESETPDAPAAFAALEDRITEWIAGKGYTEEGITVERLAKQFSTNRHYLSSYINSSRKQTFRSWINELRIKEAKGLLLQYPEMTVGEIALRVGISDRSNFIRQFSKQTDLSPQVWRKQAAQK